MKRMKNNKADILTQAINPERKNKKGSLKFAKKIVENTSESDSGAPCPQVDSLIRIKKRKISPSPIEKNVNLKTINYSISYLLQGIVPPENIKEKYSNQKFIEKNNSLRYRAVGFNLPLRVLKLVAFFLIIGLNLPGLFAVGETVAYLSDIEKTTGNSIDSSILDFSLTSGGWQPSGSLYPGSSTTENVIVADEDDSVDFKYIVSAVETGGDHNFCEKLDLEASLEGTPIYSGGLLSFISSNINFGSTADEWVFKVKLPSDASDVDGKKCEFDFLYRSWQNEFPVFPDGFHDEERLHNVIEGREYKASNVCPFNSGPKRQVTYFSKNFIRSDTNENDATDGPVIGYLPAGTYDITLASYDGHLSKPDQVQPNEQWKLIMKNASGNQVAVTDPIRDIIDATEEQAVEKVEDDFTISEDIYQFTAFHSAYSDSNPNSVRPLCAMFEGENLPATEQLIPPPTGRADNGLLALYTFEENFGQVVWDVSESGAPLNLWIPDLTKVSRVSGGLSINSSTIVSTLIPARKLINGLQATNEITIETWIKPLNITQDGPARIATLSEDTGQRDFTLAQDATRYTGRLRTTATGVNGVSPATLTPSGVASTTLQHIVYTRTPSTAKIYVNGMEVTSETITGDFSNWDTTFRFGLANEFTMNRAWLGELHLMAIYDHDLSSAEVLQNFSAGADNQIVINEFLPNPTGSDDAPMPGGEWVELYNLSGVPINVLGWTLYDNSDSNPLVISSSNSDNNGNTADSGETIIPAHGYLVVYLNGAYSEWLNNSGGDSVRLYSETVESSPLRDSYSYAGSAPENKSYARIPDGVGNFVDPIPTPLAPNKIADEPITLAEEIDESDSSSSSSKGGSEISSFSTRDFAQSSSETNPAFAQASSSETSENSSESAVQDAASSSFSSSDISSDNESELNGNGSSSSAESIEVSESSSSSSSAASSESFASSASSTLNQSPQSSASSSQSSSAESPTESSSSSDSSEQTSASSTPITRENESTTENVESDTASQNSDNSEPLPQNTDEIIVDDKAIIRENLDGGSQIISGEPPITD